MVMWVVRSGERKGTGFEGIWFGNGKFRWGGSGSAHDWSKQSRGE